MSEVVESRHGSELDLISLNRSFEVRYWEEILDCDELTLRRAVAAVGDKVDDVRAFILRRKQGPEAAHETLLQDAHEVDLTCP